MKKPVKIIFFTFLCIFSIFLLINQIERQYNGTKTFNTVSFSANSDGVKYTDDIHLILDSKQNSIIVSYQNTNYLPVKQNVNIAYFRSGLFKNENKNEYVKIYFGNNYDSIVIEELSDLKMYGQKIGYASALRFTVGDISFDTSNQISKLEVINKMKTIHNDFKTLFDNQK